MANRLMRLVAAAALSIALVAGCSGKTIEGSSKSAEAPKPDLTGLDTGTFPTEPRKLGNVDSVEEGRIVEAFRMTEAIADLPDIDPSLTHVLSRFPAVTPAEVAEQVTLADVPVVTPALERHGMVTAYGAASTDREDVFAEEGPAQDFRMVFVILARFPDAESARNAARDMDGDDFAVSAENVRVPITKYPTAHSHWRPNFPSMAATIARGELVLHVLLFNPTTNFTTLTNLITKTIDAHIPLIDKFRPTPIEDLDSLPRDPDGMLGRVSYAADDAPPAISRAVATFGPNGSRGLESGKEREEGLFDKAGVDRAAMVVNQQAFAVVLRVRDAKAASDYVASSIRLDEDIDHPIDAPKGVPGAKCFESKLDTWAEEPVRRYSCYVTHDRYIGLIAAGDETMIRQRAAAQYALLVNAS